MKKLSIEEKARAYDEALKKIKMLLGSGSSCSREELEYVFPELKESEDERIRKKLIAVVELYYGETDEQEKKDCLAWLEKQGEQKSDIGISESTKQELKDNLNNALENETPESWNEFLDEQKLAWSEEDEKIIGSIRRIIAQDAFYNDAVDVNGELCEKMYIDADNWLKALKDKVHMEAD